jgi:tetratricopeptide (TPR) repeat protein
MTRFLPFLAARIVVPLATAAILVGNELSPISPLARAETTGTEQAAALHVKTSSSEESPSEKARRARSAIKRGDYSTAREIADDVLANTHLQSWRFYPFSDFIGTVANANDPLLQIQLDAWVGHGKIEPIPLLIRAQYYYDMGWFVRGHRFTQQTRAADLVSHQDYMRKALDDVNTAIDLDDGNPYGFDLRLRILRGLGAPEDVYAAFEKAIAKFPGYYPLYETALATLQPKWGGSVAAMYALVDKYAGPAAEDSPLKLLYLSLYRHLLGYASVSCSSYRNDNDRMAQCAGVAMQKVIRPELEGSVLAALQLYDRSDKYPFGIAIEGILNDMLGTSGGDSYASAILEFAARSMHSDTQLKKERPGPNNYVVDKVVSTSWYLKGFYDNAIAKNEQALKDLEASAFPSQGEKDVAIADVYRSLARAHSKLSHYSDVIAYEKAAIALGGATSEEHFICWGHYFLKAYDEAARACTSAIDNDAGNIKAYYWRSRAHHDAGKTDDALRDLLVVANSQDNFRASAAINASMIYFGHKDIRSALDVLNRYTYLYDPDLTGRDNIAVSYNNRCYAYMQLGDLKKALEDCTASLRYGNIPDAVRKRLELMERLKARETNL